MLTKTERESIESGDLEAIKTYLSQTTNISDKDRVVDIMIKSGQQVNLDFCLNNYFSKNDIQSGIKHWFSYAIVNNKTSIIEYFMKHYKDYDYDFHYPNVLSQVTKNKHLETFKVLVSNGASFFHIDKTYHTFSNIVGNEPETVEMLKFALEHDTKLQLDYGNYLERASSKGDVDNIRLVVEHCQEKNLLTKDLFGRSLSYACRENNFDIVKYLLTNKNTKPYIDIDQYQGEPLGFACYNGNLKTVKFLLESSQLEKHADITNGDYRAVTWAAQAGYVEIIEYLFNSAKIIQEGNHKIEIDGVFYEALENKSLEVIKFLLENENVTIKPDFLSNESSLVRLIIDEGIVEHHSEIIKYLVVQGFSTQLIEQEGDDSLQYWLKSYQAEQLAEKLEMNMIESAESKNIKKVKI